MNKIVHRTKRVCIQRHLQRVIVFVGVVEIVLKYNKKKIDRTVVRVVELLLSASVFSC